MSQKLDKQLHEQHAKRLQAILNAQSSFVPHLTRPEFSTLLKLELNTLAEIEKKLPEDKLDKNLTAAHLAKEFVNLSKIEFKLGEKFKYDDEGDLIDNVNYLPTYCKNIFKVNLDDAVKGKKVVAENPNIDLRGKPEGDESPMMDAAAAFNMGAMGYTANPYENPYLMGKAYAKLNKDIAAGNVYQYKTKPRIIPLMKWFLLALIGLSMISLLIMSVFAFMANGMQINVVGTTENPKSLSTIFNGIFYLIVLGFGVYTFYITLKSFIKHDGKVNENRLYQFVWYFYLSYILLGILISLLDLRTTWFYSGSFEPVAKEGANWIGFKAWGILIPVASGLLGLALVPMIIGAVKAPKVDKEKLEGILKQYIDQESKFGPAPAFKSGAEVQKPVDVKPTTKKDSKDSKSKPHKPEQPKK